MWDEKSIYPEIESGFAFKAHMNLVYVEASNIETSNQDCYGSDISKRKKYNPPDLIVQLLPVNEKVKNIEVNSLRNGYIVVTSTSVDFQDFIKLGGKVIRIYEGFVYRKNFKS